MDETTLAAEAENAEYDMIYFKGGKGGAGSGKGNPVGKDGKKMMCSECGSEEHFWRFCTKKGSGKTSGKTSGKGSGKGKSSAFSSVPSAYPVYPQTSESSSHAHSSTPTAGASSSSGTHAGMFFGITVVEPAVRRDHTIITFMDGSPSIEVVGRSEVAANHFLSHEVVSNTPNAHAIVAQTARHDLFYPWWEISDAELQNNEESMISYHARVRLAKGESVLIDTGAIKPLAGDAWCNRAAAAAAAAGHGTVYEPLKNTLTVEGVGTGANRCTHRAVIPVAFEDGMTGTYSPAVVQDSEIPALASFDILERRRVVLDCFNGKYYEMGPGGYDITLSPGSRVIHMHKAPTGHPMLPVTEWTSVKPGASQVYPSM